MQIVKILVPKIGLFPLDYQSNKIVSVGDLVTVPFRSSKVTGIVWEIESNCNIKKPLKTLLEDELFCAKISNNLITLIKKASAYYLTELGSIAKLVLPVDINESPIKIHEETIEAEPNLYKLSNEQEASLIEIQASKKPVLVKGVTGSGKTEIYFHAIKNKLDAGKQALVMLPEIALSQQIIARFTKAFGFKPAIWNSQITKAQKKRILRGIISGNVRMVIGARSALFLPYKDLGLIIVDEEHDNSYKQDEGVLYQARDMAVLRASIERAQVILVSATPSIESIHNTEIGKYNLVELKSRFNESILPEVKTIDMRREALAQNSWLSKEAINAIHDNIEKKQQAIIFLNRRGYAPLILCRKCGYRFNCKSCSSSMVMHKSTKRLECHHCGSTSPVPTKCPECKESDSLAICGPGIERISEELERHFKNSKIAIISKEQSASTEKMRGLLEQVENGEIDILVGTQIITKGYHFPNLTLVVVVDSDIGFLGGDLRSSERTFQLLHQVGGRAGRMEKKGLVLLQTYCPEHKVINALTTGQEDLFMLEELKSREDSYMPPFSKMAAITITGKNANKTLGYAKEFASKAPQSSARILGPTESIMSKLANRYRYKILVIAKRNFHLQKYLKLWKESIKIPSYCNVKIDIDPYNLI